MIIRVKRVYDEPSSTDGFRILVDRLWPRGLTKEKAAVDEWAKEIAPSTELRKWFRHDLQHWEEFKQKYLSELKNNKQLDEFLDRHKHRKNISLLFASKEDHITHAHILHELMERRNNRQKN